MAEKCESGSVYFSSTVTINGCTIKGVALETNHEPTHRIHITLPWGEKKNYVGMTPGSCSFYYTNGHAILCKVCLDKVDRYTCYYTVCRTVEVEYCSQNVRVVTSDGASVSAHIVWGDGADEYGTTPNTFVHRYEKGKRPTVTVSASGYTSASKTFTTCISQFTLTLKKEVVQPDVGSVKVSSTPSAAKIWVKPAGSTSYYYTGYTTTQTIGGLPVGVCSVKVTKEGYTDAIKTVTIYKDKTTDVLFTLEKEEAPEEDPYKKWNCKTLREFDTAGKHIIEVECYCPSGESKITQVVDYDWSWIETVMSRHCPSVVNKYTINVLVKDQDGEPLAEAYVDIDKYTEGVWREVKCSETVITKGTCSTDAFAGDKDNIKTDYNGEVSFTLPFLPGGIPNKYGFRVGKGGYLNKKWHEDWTDRKETEPQPAPQGGPYDFVFSLTDATVANKFIVHTVGFKEGDKVSCVEAYDWSKCFVFKPTGVKVTKTPSSYPDDTVEFTEADGFKPGMTCGIGPIINIAWKWDFAMGPTWCGEFKGLKEPVISRYGPAGIVCDFFGIDPASDECRRFWAEFIDPVYVANIITGVTKGEDIYGAPYNPSKFEIAIFPVVLVCSALPFVPGAKISKFLGRAIKIGKKANKVANYFEADYVKIYRATMYGDDARLTKWRAAIEAEDVVEARRVMNDIIANPTITDADAIKRVKVGLDELDSTITNKVKVGSNANDLKSRMVNIANEYADPDIYVKSMDDAYSDYITVMQRGTRDKATDVFTKAAVRVCSPAPWKCKYSVLNATDKLKIGKEELDLLDITKILKENVKETDVLYKKAFRGLADLKEGDIRGLNFLIDTGAEKRVVMELRTHANKVPDKKSFDWLLHQNEWALNKWGKKWTHISRGSGFGKEFLEATWKTFENYSSIRKAAKAEKAPVEIEGKLWDLAGATIPDGKIIPQYKLHVRGLWGWMGRHKSATGIATAWIFLMGPWFTIDNSQFIVYLLRAAGILSETWGNQWAAARRDLESAYYSLRDNPCVKTYQTQYLNAMGRMDTLITGAKAIPADKIEKGKHVLSVLYGFDIGDPEATVLDAAKANFAAWDERYFTLTQPCISPQEPPWGWPVMPVLDEVLHDVKVVKVIDGDTIDIYSDEIEWPHGETIRVRILGINTPEGKSKNYLVRRMATISGEEERWNVDKALYDKVNKWADELLWHEKVTLKSDSSRQWDDYHRFLAVVNKDSMDVGKKESELGYAPVYFYDANKQVNVSAYLAAEKIAKDANVGVWRFFGDTGTIRCISSPETAVDVYVDSELEPRGKTVSNVFLMERVTVGTHTITFKKLVSGVLHSCTTSVTVLKDRTVEATCEMTVAGKASFWIDSDPQGAKIYIDGTYKNDLTPANKVFVIDAGTHSFKLVKAGCTTWVKSYTLSEGEEWFYNKATKSKTVSLVCEEPEEPEKGKMHCKTFKPDGKTLSNAKIYVTGGKYSNTYMGDTEKTLTIKTGTYTVRYTHPDYTDDCVKTNVVVSTVGISDAVCQFTDGVVPPEEEEAVWHITEAKDAITGAAITRAKVYVDDVYIHGWAPEDITFCAGCKCDTYVDCGFGTHTVKVVKDDKEWTKTRDLKAGDDFTDTPLLEELAAITVTFKSAPEGATVRIDGKLISLYRLTGALKRVKRLGY